jgi:catechol 2,3-dioxygenase-like lactoylglutathione lyase family enzyme
MTRPVAAATLPPLILLLLSLVSKSLTAGEPGRAALVSGVCSISITVRDTEHAVRFYTDVLNFRKVTETELKGEAYQRLTGVAGARARTVRMMLGDETIELTEYLAPHDGRAMPADSRSNDHWFQHIAIVVRDIDEAYRQLRKHKVEHASSAPQRLPDWNKAAGGIEAFYFRDPDGHFLEVIHFPRGKGQPKWQETTDRLFLGIDHTAIVVADTDASLSFYRDHLGLAVVGESENFGSEQEHLNNVFGARLKITSLRARSGPGIELLEYLNPRDGRRAPPDSKANDLWHWQTRLRANKLSTAVDVILAGGGQNVSPEVVDASDKRLEYTQSLLARDPDGHAVLFTDR